MQLYLSSGLYNNQGQGCSCLSIEINNIIRVASQNLGLLNKRSGQWFIFL